MAFIGVITSNKNEEVLKKSIENILKNYPDCFSYVENVNKVIGYFDRVKK